MASILLVDSDPRLLRLLDSILSIRGHRVWTANSVEAAAQLGTQYHFPLLITNMPEVLAWFRRNSRGTHALTGIRRPLATVDELHLMVRRALDHRELESIREEFRQRYPFESLIAEDPKMVKAVARGRKAAEGGGAVLITGEAGTGKEALALCIHSASARAGRAFETVDCAAFTPDQIEVELFGGAKNGPGRLERADGGTLFLKEAGLLDATLQSRIVRAVREKTFERTGTSRLGMSDVRLIGATSKPGGFASRPYSIAIPPLRQRRADIPLLAKLFLGRAKPELAITPETLEQLGGYDWPGNLRELENAMVRAAMVCERVVTVDDLPALGIRRENAPPLTMAEIERRSIEEAVGSHGGNRTRAAAQLGISLRNIQYKIKQYGLAERSRKF